MSIIIKNGYVFDPINGVDCERKDIFLSNGKVVEEIRDKNSKRSTLGVL
jgi:formylmethanofuran dehydrogenase subunit A